VSDNGVLVAAPTFATPSRLLWVNREGKQIGEFGGAGLIQSARLSPDGRRVAVVVADLGRDTSEIWIDDVATGSGTKFVFSSAHETGPVWSPDGSRLAFTSDRKAPSARNDVWFKSLDGSREHALSESADERHPEDWSPDGRYLSIGIIQAKGSRNAQLWILDTREQKVFPFETEAQYSVASRFSPDPRWLAYASDESGRFEVYVRAFPGPGGKWQVSNAGGGYPVWSRDGKELFYLTLDNKIASVRVASSGATFSAAPPVLLFAAHPAAYPGPAPFDVSPDGKRFLVNSLPADQGSPPLEVIANWPSLLGKN
jgi:Tol biopolymer transport system component